MRASPYGFAACPSVGLGNGDPFAPPASPTSPAVGLGDGVATVGVGVGVGGVVDAVGVPAVAAPSDGVPSPGTSGNVPSSESPAAARRLSGQS